jgi:serine/threonine protein phosphatase PrpC
MPQPSLCWATASRPKPGHTTAENEDATAADGLHFAVCDGATEGWQSGEWAAHLAGLFVRRPPTPADFVEWLAAAHNRWKPPAPKEAVPWYAEAKRAEGSFATLLGVEFRASRKTPGQWAWKAVAVGDSCLVRIRGGKVIESFPLSSASAFTNRPHLVPSSATTPCPEPEWLAGRAEPGDVFVLATDAVAASLLSGKDPVWKRFRADPGVPESERLLDLLGSLSPAPNDDATVVHIQLPERAESPR